ncbi:MAG: hypothetical protein EPN85_03795 [Bacteroidetes bacterium]|nr:MAG: hypothetical protein EPN85_03795 [Bacteroidota bacterium]
MNTDFLRFFYQRPDIKLNRKVFVFIVCLIVSFFTWLQINLSKEHIDSVLVKVDFVNLPQSRLGRTKMTDTLLVEVEADGYGLLKYEMKEITIDFKRLKRDINSGFFYFLPNNYTKTISKQLGDNFKVIRVIADTVHLKSRLR